MNFSPWLIEYCNEYAFELWIQIMYMNTYMNYELLIQTLAVLFFFIEENCPIKVPDTVK